MSETDRGNVAATGGGQAGTGTAKDAPARSAGVEPEFWARYRYARVRFGRGSLLWPRRVGPIRPR